MTVSEKVSYLKGLVEGLDVDMETKEGKILGGIMDVLQEIALDMADLEDCVEAIGTDLDTICDEIDDIEDVVFDDDYCCCGDDDDDDDSFDDDDMYSVECPNCHEELAVDESIIEQGEFECPNCGEKLEFELEDEDGEE